MLDLYEEFKSLIARLTERRIDYALDFLTLDLLLVTPALREVWASRSTVSWEGGELPVVSREGLIAMKRLRNSGQDQDDIASLEQGGQNEG
jgi:hypothetical protein